MQKTVPPMAAHTWGWPPTRPHAGMATHTSCWGWRVCSWGWPLTSGGGGFKSAAPGGISTRADDEEETVEMARSRSSVALPKAALICAAERLPAAALRLGRGLVSHGLGGAKRIGTDGRAGTQRCERDAASPTAIRTAERTTCLHLLLMAAVTELAVVENRRRLRFRSPPWSL